MSITLVLVLLFGIGAYFAARARAAAFVGTGGRIGAVHSLPVYHGAFVAVAALVPALLLLGIWAIVGEGVIQNSVLSAVPAASRPETPLDVSAFMNEVRGLASGDIGVAFNPAAEAAVPNYRATRGNYNIIVGAVAVTLFALGALWGFSQLRPDFRARNRVEVLVKWLLIGASLVAILTTLGIVLSLVFESVRFFQQVSPIEFLFGTHWSPQTAIRADQVGSTGAFGAVPLFWGTIFIGAIIAMIVAIPLGLMSAIYLTQYADPAVRRYLKPMLELLAGVPTVVYGFFAALTVAPAVRNFAVSLGYADASAESALAAGLVMGIMIIPFVSSMADDALAAVPQAMRDGSLAMGATKSETVKRVLVPAALPGIVGGILLAVSRAIGETMIVVMAAGLAANLTLNPFQSVTTVTAQIVALLTGDQEFDSPKTLSAFALGLALFVITLVLNIYALAVVKKYREAYE
ncbi:phosphate ABC transporter permease subunit PstC [Polymorphobacter fuscus]|uniref:Phosphate transport system permease protein n=1 Tax=Sandarakinorhabdus fusca TaxID=1439888 RepID=A0A7C9KGJ4_9SPHN|nr:phosphate ABC transporter permease subunit PstC [Polymorphobacter fuscus]KAB7649075.1 phosphate ABC transporter permease subunit PstC [Polymorphobacter fuscus]MQT16140.1 phosphate ABC transporter permease subunit PstC [Polymorphobacter fuscus]